MKQWKRIYPELSFENWLRICSKKQHRNKEASDVVAGIIKNEEEIERLLEQ